MSMQGFLEELQAGLKSPAYLLHAGDPYLLKEALLAAKNSVPEGDRDFLFQSFDMADSAPSDSPSVEHVLDALNTVPFLPGGRRIIALEGAEKIPAKGLKPVTGYLSKPSPDSVFIILFAGAPKKAVMEALRGARAVALDIRERDLPAWLRERARQKGLALSSGAVEYLIGTVGPEPGLLSSEVEKLVMSGRKKLEKDDLVEMVRGSGDYDAFDLIDALRTGDADRVFRIYASLSETQEPYSLLGALNWHYSRRLGNGEDRARVFALLSEADTMLKSSGGAYPLEYLLARLLRL